MNTENVNPTKSMSYEEREALKQLAGDLSYAGKTHDLKELITMIAHWMRCSLNVTFSDYAANWADVQTQEGVEAIRQKWPLNSAATVIKAEFL
jgi:hypothetical protein